MAREVTLAEVAVRNLMPDDAKGALSGRVATLKATQQAAKALTTVVSLALCAQRGAGVDGAWPTQAEYAAWWKIGERQAQHEWALFKRAFPGEKSPDRLARALLEKYPAALTQGERGNPGVAFSAPAALAF